MAGANPALVIRIAATIDQLKANLAQAKTEIAGAAGAFSESVHKASDVVQKNWATIYASAETASRGIKGVATAAGGWLTAAAESEAATARLTAALRANGTFTPELLQKYLDLATQFQKTGVHADELVVDMAGMLTQVGHVMPEQMAGALQAAMNLSAGLKIDLPAATMLLSKALGTGGESLGRLKGLLGDTEIKGKDAESVLAAINSRFGGQAQAQAETYAGKLASVNNQYGEMHEKAGELLAKVLMPLMNWFSNLSPTMQTVVAGIGTLITVLAPLGMAIGGISTALALLMPVLTVAVPGAFVAIGAAFVAIAPFLLPAGVIIGGITAIYLAFKNWDAIKGFVQGVYTGVKEWLVDKFQAVVEGVKSKVNAVTGFFKDMYDKIVGHSYVIDLVTGVTNAFALFQTVMVEPAVAATDAVVDAFERAADGTEVLRSNLRFTAETIAEEVTPQIENLRSQLDLMRDAMTGRMGAGSNPMPGFSGNLPNINPATGAGKEGTDPLVWGYLQQGYTLGEAIALARGGTAIGLPHGRWTAEGWKQGTGFAPGFAAGGHMRAGQAGIVGERGPELFVPDRSGTVVPNGAGQTFVFAPVLNGAIYGTDKQRVARELFDDFAAYMKSRGERFASGA